MKFEEVLPLMREGKKARIRTKYDEDLWFCGDWIMGLFWLPGCEDEKWMSLMCLDKEGRAIANKYSWGMPTDMIVCEDWEIVEDEEIKL